MTDHVTVSGITDGIWRVAVGFLRDPNPRPTLRLLGDKVPTVDLLIVACGEPIEVIMDTVRAACFIDYPAKKFRIIVADDGNNAVLRAEVNELRGSHGNLYYHARIKPLGVHHGFKAGNINKTMEFVARLAGGHGDFMAVLDADMIPEPEILRALLPHAIKDNKVGMVVCAQVCRLASIDVVTC